MRLFVGIDINDIKIEKLQHSLIKKFNFNHQYVKPIKKNNLHLTIKFLGEKTDLEVKDIISDLSKINFTSFNIVFNNIGVFPHMKSPRIIWIGLDDESNRKLNDIYLQLNSVLQKYDIIQNKDAHLDIDSQKFLPHLTIFRIYKNHKIPNFISNFDDMIISENEVNTISLKKSILTPNGSIYSDLFNIYANKRNA
jgi:RNA 2',3'-cyclic 3'-phosphodiesterase